MDLKSILGYRNKCIFCQKDLVFYNADYPKLQFYIGENGFRISSGYLKSGSLMLFNFNGSYQRNKRNYKIYNKPLIINRHCPTCRATASWSSISPASSALSTTTYATTQAHATTFDNMRDLQCSYVFQLMGNDLGYSAHMNWESIKYNDNESFYHMNTSFVSGTSILTHSKFDSLIDNILTLKIANTVNLSKITSTEQFIDKCKTIILFS